ncbi:MAG TPA: hypothetical protein VKB69_05210 [Micromonosporaceae bacterium]|nr:hypothetical protein [Micromonosporaceae bacterium]
MRASTVVATSFAALPLITLGFATPIAFAFAAMLRRSWLLGLAAVGYLAAVVGMFTLEGAGGWYGTCIVTAWLGGTVHAVMVAPGVARAVRSDRQADPDQLATLVEATRGEIATDPVLTAMVERRERRRIAREIVERDPALADDLGIGQPGRRGGFDDGGLIDVNRVDVGVLETMPGFDRDLADRVVAARQRFEGLGSLADLVVHADVPTEVAEHLADRLLFRPLDDVRPEA